MIGIGKDLQIGYKTIALFDIFATPKFSGLTPHQLTSKLDEMLSKILIPLTMSQLIVSFKQPWSLLAKNLEIHLYSKLLFFYR